MYLDSISVCVLCLSLIIELIKFKFNSSSLAGNAGMYQPDRLPGKYGYVLLHLFNSLHTCFEQFLVPSATFKCASISSVLVYFSSFEQFLVP